MFGIGMPEMLLILAVALIIIGPKKLPDLAKSLGRALGDFKRATSDLKESIEMETGLDEVRENLDTVKDDIKASVSEADQATVSDPTDKLKKTAPQEPLTQVKASFDELNTPTDSDPDPTGEDDGMGEDYHPDSDDAQQPASEAPKGEDPDPEDKATS